MARTNMDFVLSVESETGTYWHGDRELRTQAQVIGIIEQLAGKQVYKGVYADRNRTCITQNKMDVTQSEATCHHARWKFAV